MDIKTFNVFVSYLLVAQEKRDGLTLENWPAGIGKDGVCYNLDKHTVLQVR